MNTASGDASLPGPSVSMLPVPEATLIGALGVAFLLQVLLIFKITLLKLFTSEKKRC